MIHRNLTGSGKRDGFTPRQNMKVGPGKAIGRDLLDHTSSDHYAPTSTTLLFAPRRWSEGQAIAKKSDEQFIAASAAAGRADLEGRLPNNARAMVLLSLIAFDPEASIAKTNELRDDGGNILTEYFDFDSTALRRIGRIIAVTHRVEQSHIVQARGGRQSIVDPLPVFDELAPNLYAHLEIADGLASPGSVSAAQ